MHNSIQQFMTFGVKTIEKVIESFINDETTNIGGSVTQLGKPLQELQREIIAEIIERIDEIYRNATYRTDRQVIERASVQNSFTSTCGEIKYNRTYFESKETGKYVSLQFNKVKGDLKIGTNGYKSNIIEPRLACVFEGIKKES